ncbi:MAG: phosphoethanolamine transferase [Fibrobacterales bacterium]
MTTMLIELNGDTLFDDTVSYAYPRNIPLSMMPGDEIKLTIGAAGSVNQDLTYIALSKFSLLTWIVPWVLPLLLAFFIWQVLRRRLWIYGFLTPLIMGLLFVTESLNVGWPTLESGIYYMLMIGTYSGLSVIISMALPTLPNVFKGLLHTVLMLVAFGLPLTYGLYNLYYQVGVEMNIFWAIFQSNHFESVEYVQSIFSVTWVVISVVIIICFSILFYIYEKRERQYINRIRLMALILLGLTLMFVQSKQYPHWNLVVDALEDYQREFTMFINVKNERRQSLETLPMQRHHDDELAVLILGESLNRGHMSLYGYPRETNPHLTSIAEADTNFVVFDNVWSNAVSTMPALSLALTEADRYKKKKYSDSYSIMDVTKRAGIHTTWITNHRLQGKYDNLVAVIATDADEIIPVNSNIGMTNVANPHDDRLLRPAFKAFEKESGLVVVHLLGNHQGYSNRYPRAYKKYGGDLPERIYGNKVQEKLHNTVNKYDNSVLYNDSIVAKILDSLRAIKKPTLFMYISDHGDDVFTRKYHNKSVFTFEMAYIPFVVWMSPEYVERYPERAAVVKSNKNRLYTNDFLFHTLVGFLPISTPIYDSTSDIGHAAYHLNERKATTERGKIKISKSTNSHYWRYTNRKLLAPLVPNAAVVCNDVYTEGSVAYAQRDSIGGVMLTLHEGIDDTAFLVGSKNNSIEYTFSEYLADVRLKGIYSLWLNRSDTTQSIDSIVKKVAGAYDSHYISELNISLTNNNDYAHFKYDGSNYQLVENGVSVGTETVDTLKDSLVLLYNTRLSLNDSRLMRKLKKDSIPLDGSLPLLMRCPDYFHK